MRAGNSVMWVVLAAGLTLASSALAGVGARVETKEEARGQFNAYVVAWNSDWLPVFGRECYVDVKRWTRQGNGVWSDWETMRFTFHDGGLAKSIFQAVLGPSGTTQAEVLGYGFR